MKFSLRTSVIVPAPAKPVDSAGRWRPTILVACWAVCLWWTATARAETKVAVDYGWQQNYQPGAWTPVYFTVWDPELPSVGRRGRLTISVPGDIQGGSNISLTLHIGAEEQTYVVYVPLRSSLSNVTLRLSDAQSGQVLYRDHLLAENGFGGSYIFNQPKVIIARAGSHGGAQIRVSSRDQKATVVVNPRIEELPDVAIGYEGFAALMLDEPQLSRLMPRQQQAIVDWVEAGGSLVYQPGDELPPAGSPLLQILPARIGSVRTVLLSQGVLSTWDLPQRFSKLVGYDLIADADAEKIPLLGGNGTYMLRARRGLGQVGILSFSASELLFSDEKLAEEFWTPIFAAVATPQALQVNPASGQVEALPLVPQTPQDEAAMAANAAAGRTMDFLGDVPGMGSFDFKYVVIVLAFLMLAVGPLDWVVLRKLGKLQWTWITTAMWIVLVTFGALYIGHVFRSGQLYFRTLRLIDQASGATVDSPRDRTGGRIVASTSVVCIYSPQTQIYTLSTPGGWWKPMQPVESGYGLKNESEIPFSQDLAADSNRPMPMPINVWNLRFYSSQGPADAPPVAAANLSLSEERADHNQREELRGTITNLSDRPLKDVRIRVHDGVVTLDQAINPHSTANVAALVDRKSQFGQITGSMYSPYYFNGRYYPTGIGDEDYHQGGPALIETVAALSPAQWSRVESLLQHEPVAVIYGQWMQAAPAATLVDPAPQKQENWEFLRAVVELSSSTSDRDVR